MKTIIQHLNDIEYMELVLPEFQREYVWRKGQAKQLMVSLFKGYPIGSLLLWETASPPDIKNNAIAKKQGGLVKVLLDGQQRLTTLYLLIKGKIPPYYTEKEIEHDPRDLYFHLITTEFEYYGPVKMGQDPHWVKVTDFFNGVKPDIISLSMTDEGVDAQKLATLNANTQHLESIKNNDYPAQTVPSTADIEDAIDVFDRVNSMGTRLTEAELALTHMSGKWPEIRRVFKDKLARLSSKSFSFTLDFLVRAIIAVSKNGASYERGHRIDKQALEKSWETLDHVLDELVSLLKGEAYIHSSDDLTTSNVLIPLVAYYAENGSFDDENTKKRFLYWMYQAMLWGRYSGRADDSLEADIRHALSEDGDPVDALLKEITAARGRLDLRPADLEGRSVRNPAYRLLRIVVKSHGAVDWFTGHPLAGYAENLGYTSLFSNHLLYDEGSYDSNNHMHRKMTNEIANRVLTVDASRFSNDAPAKLFKKVTKRFPNALAQQFIPEVPEVWTPDKFEEFLELRRQMIASGINSFLSNLISEEIPATVFPQLAKIQDVSYLEDCRKAVTKLNFEEVHIGLFELSKLFEKIIKEYFVAIAKAGAYDLPDKYETMALHTRINWLAARGIVSDKGALLAIKNVRNDGAHPNLNEQKITFNYSIFFANLYLDYICLFIEKRDELLRNSSTVVSS